MDVCISPLLNFWLVTSQLLVGDFHERTRVTFYDCMLAMLCTLQARCRQSYQFGVPHHPGEHDDAAVVWSAHPAPSTEIKEIECINDYQ